MAQRYGSFPTFVPNSQLMQEPAVIKKFRAIGTAEGISFLVLLGVAMPLKYMMDMPKAVTYIGWIHGVLFVWYCYMVIEAGQALKWKFGRIFLAFLASLLPLGPFLFDRWFLRKGKSVLEE
jgi:integral membrane protein